MTRRDTLFISLLMAAPLMFLCGTVTSNHSFFMRDLTYLFHPWRTLSAQMVQAGDMPLWNPYALGGMPFLANAQSAILYPLTAPFYFLGFSHALKLFHYFHYALAGLGFYLASRKWGFNQWAAFGAAILFAYNGYALTRMEFPSVLGTLIWLPWLLLFCPVGNGSVQPLPTIAAALVMAVSMTAGYPQILLLQIAAAMALTAAFTPAMSTLKFWGIAGLGSAALSMAQWWPTLELIGQSVRGGAGLPLDEAVTYSLPADSLLGLIYPFRILHHPDRFTGEKFFWIWSAWWGMAATVVALFAFRLKRKRLLIVAVALSLAGVLWAMGDQWPWYEWLFRHISIVRLFRYPPVALYWTAVGISLMALCGLSALRCMCFRTRLWKCVPAIAVCAIGFELWNYSRGILPTAPDEYWTVTFPAIQTLMKDRPGTVMLSPKANHQRRLAGMTSLEAKMRFRGYLFDETNLPYRIKTIIPSGEPLALQSFQRMYTNLSTFPSLESAGPLLRLWNVTHILTHDAPKAGWTEIGRDNDLLVLRQNGAMGEAFGLSPEIPGSKEPPTPVQPQSLILSNDHARALFESSTELLALFNQPIYPGWRAWVDGRPAPQIPVQNYFLGVPLPAGKHHIHLKYCPKPWLWGSLISTLCALALAGLGLKRWISYNEEKP